MATTPRVRPAVAKQAYLDPPSHLLSFLLSHIVATDTPKLHAPHYGAGVLRNRNVRRGIRNEASLMNYLLAVGGLGLLPLDPKASCNP